MRAQQLCRGAIAFLASAALMACSAQKPVPTKIVWQKADGSEATREELEAAKAVCVETTRQDGSLEDSGRFGNVGWAVDMLDCMKSKGYERIEKPVE